MTLFSPPLYIQLYFFFRAKDIVGEPVLEPNAYDVPPLQELNEGIINTVHVFLGGSRRY